MSIYSLPPEILAVIAEKLEKDDWKRLVLVSKDFRNATRRLLWKSLTIHNLEKLESVLKLFKDEEYLGRSVKRLYMKLNNVDSQEVSRVRESSIPKNQFIQLIREVPLMNDLSLYSRHLEPFNSNEIIDKSLFSSVNRFTYIGGYEHDQDLLQTFLHIAPNITTLEIDKLNPSNQSLSSCPSLVSLGCHVSEFFRIDNHSFIPLNALTRLQCLTIFDIHLEPRGRVDLLKFIEICSSTLLDIYIGQDIIIKYHLFKPLLATLKVIETLYVGMSNIPVDFLQQIPNSMQHLEVTILVKHLQHLHRHPRPSLNLISLYFNKFSKGLVEFLPQSVVKIQITWLEINLNDESTSTCGGNILLQELNNFGRKRLRCIEVMEIRTQDEESQIVERFVALGIELEIFDFE